MVTVVRIGFGVGLVLATMLARDCWREHRRRAVARYEAEARARQAQDRARWQWERDQERRLESERKMTAMLERVRAQDPWAVQMDEIAALSEVEHPPIRYAAGRWYTAEHAAARARRREARS